MLSCQITSAQGSEEYSNLESVFLPESAGQIQILPGHAEIFLLLSLGDIVLNQAGGKIITVPATGGECHFKDNQVSIIL